MIHAVNGLKHKTKQQNSPLNECNVNMKWKKVVCLFVSVCACVVVFVVRGSVCERSRRKHTVCV